MVENVYYCASKLRTSQFAGAQTPKALFSHPQLHRLSHPLTKTHLQSKSAAYLLSPLSVQLKHKELDFLSNVARECVRVFHTALGESSSPTLWVMSSSFCPFSPLWAMRNALITPPVEQTFGSACPAVLCS